MRLCHVPPDADQGWDDQVVLAAEAAVCGAHAPRHDAVLVVLVDPAEGSGAPQVEVPAGNGNDSSSESVDDTHRDVPTESEDSDEMLSTVLSIDSCSQFVPHSIFA